LAEALFVVFPPLFFDFVSLQALATDETGAFLLDSDVRFFRPILNYLRRGEVLVDPADVAGVLAEAK
jgi:hypothetical protein